MKKRSGAYPSRTIQQSETFSVSVFEKVGETFLDYAGLSTHGGVALRDADGYAASSGQYGFMTQKYGKGYAPNSIICKALRTPKDGEKHQLYLNAFTSPPIYKIIANEFNGKKITEEGLKINLIRDHEFSDAGAKTAAKIFLDNSKFLGLIDNDSNFNIDADIKIEPIEPKVKKSQSNVQTPGTSVKKNATDKAKPKLDDAKPSYTPSTGNSSGLKKVSIFVRGHELLWAVPEDVNQSDWDTMIKQLQNIKSFSK